MTFTIPVRGEDLEIKFDYGTMFKANKRLGSKNQKTGETNEDGASNLFNRVLNQDDSAIMDLINLVLPKKKKAITEEDFFNSVEAYIAEYDDESEGYDALFEEVKGEMLDSGFFVKKLEKQIENMELSKEIIAGRDDDESQMQLKAIEKNVENLRKAISSHNVPD